MNITFDIFPPLLFVLLIVWAAFFLLSLADALGRDDLDPVTRLTWVVVLIFVPFCGLVLYMTVAPKRPLSSRLGSGDLHGTPWAADSGHTHSGPRDQ